MSLTINGGAAVTYTSAVTLALAAPAGATQMRFSDDNATWTAWTPFAAEKPYTLSAGNGTKTVYVQFGDAAVPPAPLGSDSAPITLATGPGAILINGGAAETSSQSVTLTLTAPSADPTEMRFHNEGNGWGPWQKFAASISWSLSGSYGAKTVSVEYRNASNQIATGASANIVVYSSGIANATGTWLILKTPDYSDAEGGEQTSYLRLGAPDLAAENALLDSHGGVQEDGNNTRKDPNTQKFVNLLRDGTPQKTRPGWFEYTDGDRSLVVRGANLEHIHGNHITTVGGDKIDYVTGAYKTYMGVGTLEVLNSDPIYSINFRKTDVMAGGKEGWRKTEFSHNSSDSYSFGDVEEFFGGYKFDAMFGMTNSIFAGGKVDVSATASMELNIGYAMEFGAGLKYSNTAGKELTVSDDNEIKARKSIHLRIKESHEGVKSTPHKFAAAALATIGTVGAAALAAVASGGEVDANGYSAQADGALGAATGVFAAFLAASVFCALRDKAERPISSAEIKLSAEGIDIRTNDAHGAPQAQIQLGENLENNEIVISNVVGSFPGSKLLLDEKGNIELLAFKKLILGNDKCQGTVVIDEEGKMKIKAGRVVIHAPATEMGHLLIEE